MIDVNVNVRVDFPALDKIATLMCVKSEEISSALSRIPDVITPQPVEEPAVEAPAEEAPAEKPKRTRKKAEKPAQEAPETPVQPEEPKAEEVVEPAEEPAAEPAETPVETAEEAPAKDYTLAQLSAACMRLRDRNPDALEQARALFGKYGVTGLAGLKGDQDKLNGFASDLIALGAEL